MRGPLTDDGLAPRYPGLNHSAWTFDDIESWERQARHIAESGWPVEFRMENGMSHSIYVKNPDGFITEAMYESPREYRIDNIEAALQHRRIITPDEPDYLDPVEGFKAMIQTVVNTMRPTNPTTSTPSKATTRDSQPTASPTAHRTGRTLV